MSMSLLLEWGAYARDKNTSTRLCAKNAGGTYAQGWAYLRDTTVSETLRICIYIEEEQHAIIKLRAFTISTFVI